MFQALLRPGRFDHIVHVPLPDEMTREEIFKINLNKFIGTDVNMRELVKHTAGYSGADIRGICEKAKQKLMEENMNSRIITQIHLDAALSIVSKHRQSIMLECHDDDQEIEQMTLHTNSQEIPDDMEKEYYDNRDKFLNSSILNALYLIHVGAIIFHVISGIRNCK